MNKILITHPDNEPWLKQHMGEIFPEHTDRLGLIWGGLPPFVTIKYSHYVDRWQPSKSIRLPDGKVVAKDKFQLKTRFVTYGPEDLRWLMWAGVIEEQLEPAFWLMDEPMRIFTMDYAVPKIDRRALVLSTFV